MQNSVNHVPGIKCKPGTKKYICLTISEQETTSSLVGVRDGEFEEKLGSRNGKTVAPDFESEAFFVFECWLSSRSSLDVQ